MIMILSAMKHTTLSKIVTKVFSVTVNLTRLFSNDDELAEFVVRSGMSRKDVAELAEDYYDDGANTHVVMIEIETFAVARAVDPRTIANKLVEFCTTRF